MTARERAPAPSRIVGGMSETQQPAAGTPLPGTIGWIDLTVPDAPRVRDFYRDVVGWEVSEVDMGGYSDYCMHPPGGAPPAAGVCHARGSNTGLPPQWLLYAVVEDVRASAARAVELGGALVREPRSSGMGTFCVVRDPAGAVMALWQPAPPSNG